MKTGSIHVQVFCIRTNTNSIFSMQITIYQTDQNPLCLVFLKEDKKTEYAVVPVPNIFSQQTGWQPIYDELEDIRYKRSLFTYHLHLMLRILEKYLSVKNKWMIDSFLILLQTAVKVSSLKESNLRKDRITKGKELPRLYDILKKSLEISPLRHKLLKSQSIMQASRDCEGFIFPGTFGIMTWPPSIFFSRLFFFEYRVMSPA